MQIACTLTWPQDFSHIIHVIQEELKKVRAKCAQMVWVMKDGKNYRMVKPSWKRSGLANEMSDSDLSRSDL